MAGHSRPKDGVLSHAYVPAIHVFLVARPGDVDARDKPGHDGGDVGISLDVIPGRAESANPESRNTHRARIWIPGPALTRRPGMTDAYLDFNPM